MGIVIRQSIKAIIVNYVGTFIGFLTTMFILTNYIDPEVIGLTRVLYEASLFIANIALMGITSSTMRFFPYFRNPENKDNGFFYYLLLLPTFGILIYIPVYLLLKGTIGAFFTKNSELFMDYYYWIIPLVLFLVYWITFETYATQMMRIVIPKFIREIGVRIMLVVIYLLYAFNYFSLDQLIISFVVVYGLALICSFIYVCHIGKVTFKHDFSFIDSSLRKKILRYTLFLVLGTLGGGILNQLDLFMVSSKLGLDYAGIFSIAFYMGIVIEIPSRSITSITSPLAAMALKENNFVAANDLYRKVALHQFVAGSSVFLLIWINIDNIFAIIPNGQIYQLGKWVVFFIGLSRLLAITLNFGATLISFSRYYYWGLYFTVFLTALGICTNLLLIPRWGITGAAVATFISSILYYTLQQWIVLIKIKGNPYSRGILKQILLISVLLGIDYLLPTWESNPYLDGIYRSFIIAGLGIYLMYRFKISDEICLLIKKSLTFITNRS